MIWELQESGFQYDKFLWEVSRAKDIITFLNLWCTTFTKWEMTENWLTICQMLSENEEFYKEISQWKGYLKWLTRFCAEFEIEEEEDKEHVFTLINILNNVFKKHLEDSSKDIAQAIEVIAPYDWATQELFDSENK